MGLMTIPSPFITGLLVDAWGFRSLFWSADRPRGARPAGHADHPRVARPQNARLDYSVARCSAVASPRSWPASASGVVGLDRRRHPADAPRRPRAHRDLGADRTAYHRRDRGSALLPSRPDAAHLPLRRIRVRHHLPVRDTRPDHVHDAVRARPGLRLRCRREGCRSAPDPDGPGQRHRRHRRRPNPAQDLPHPHPCGRCGSAVARLRVHGVLARRQGRSPLRHPAVRPRMGATTASIRTSPSPRCRRRSRRRCRAWSRRRRR